MRSLAGFRCKSSSCGTIGYIPFGPGTGTAAGSGSDVGSFAGTHNLICIWGISRHTGVRGIPSWSTSLGLMAGNFTTARCFTAGVLAVIQKPEIALAAAGYVMSEGRVYIIRADGDGRCHRDVAVVPMGGSSAKSRIAQKRHGD